MARGHYYLIYPIGPIAISAGKITLEIASKMYHHADYLGKRYLSIIRAARPSYICINFLFLSFLKRGISSLSLSK